MDGEPIIITVEPQGEVVEFFVGCRCPECGAPMAPASLEVRVGTLRVYKCTEDFCEVLAEIPEALQKSIECRPTAMAEMWFGFVTRVQSETAATTYLASLTSDEGGC